MKEENTRSSIILEKLQYQMKRKIRHPKKDILKNPKNRRITKQIWQLQSVENEWNRKKFYNILGESGNIIIETKQTLRQWKEYIGTISW